MTATSPGCPPAETGAARPPAGCRRSCALEVVDGLLAARGAVTGEEADLLLDLRWQLRQRADAEAALRLFCDLRRRLETRQYLAFFRLRRWLENHLVAEVRLCPAAPPQAVPVRLQFFCPEAIRRAALCTALGRGTPLLAPRVQFAFRPLPVARTAPLEPALA